LIYELIKNGKESPPPNRRKLECEEELRLFYQCHQAEIYEAVPAICPPATSKDTLSSILADPASHTKDRCYSVIRAFFTQEGRELRKGIRIKVREFFENERLWENSYDPLSPKEE
jgi:hypothetical protein